MQMGLDRDTREAAAFWALDSVLPARVLDQVRGLKEVVRAFTVQVG